MTHEHNAIEVLPFDVVDDVIDVRGERDRLTCQVRAFTDAGERWRNHVASTGDQSVGDASPAPSAVPAAVDEHKGRALGQAECAWNGWQGRGSDDNCSGKK